MSKYKSAGGVQVKVDAAPEQLPVPKLPDNGKKGEIEAVFVNYSRIPATALFRRLRSGNRHVATTQNLRVTTIQIPARPGKYTSQQPSVVSTKVGSWHPRNKGVTSITCQFEISTATATLGQCDPNTDVETI